MNESFFKSENYTLVNYTNKLDWLFPMAISAILLFVTAWILLSLLLHGMKAKKWRQNRKSNFEKLNRGMIYMSVIGCALCCVVCISFSLIYMNIGFKKEEDQLCNVMFGLVGSSYGVVVWSTYMFLWFRQRTFYMNRMLNINYTRAAKFISTASIIVITLGGIGVVLFSSIPNDQYASPDGCKYRPHKTMKIAYWIAIAFVVCFGHLVLFSLLAYALKTASDTRAFFNGTLRSVSKRSLETSSRNQKRDFNGNPTFRSPKVLKDFPTRKSRSSSCASVDITNVLIKAVLQKTLFFSVVSALMEMLLQCLLYFSDIHRRIITTFFIVNVFFNLLFVIFSFVRDKKQMLFAPFFYFCKNE